MKNLAPEFPRLKIPTVSERAQTPVSTNVYLYHSLHNYSQQLAQMNLNARVLGRCQGDERNESIKL